MDRLLSDNHYHRARTSTDQQPLHNPLARLPATIASCQILFNQLHMLGLQQQLLPPANSSPRRRAILDPVWVPKLTTMLSNIHLSTNLLPVMHHLRLPLQPILRLQSPQLRLRLRLPITS